jgi:predicted membrane chloride channel (bestrophin family)
MKKLIRSISLIINYKTFIITGLSIISSYLCFHYELTASFPDMLVGIAIVFPVVFSISSAFNRRENALKHLSDFHGHAIAIYYASRDWTTDKNNDAPQRVKDICHQMLMLMKLMLRKNSTEDSSESEAKMYLQFSDMSKLTGDLRKYGVQSGEISRLNQYLSKMVIAYDNIKMIHQYRTPITLRAYSKVFIYIFPIVYGPYFANTFHSYSAQLEYVMPVLYSFILVSLDNIQDHLEHPFDEEGEDDIIIDVDRTIKLLS